MTQKTDLSNRCHGRGRWGAPILCTLLAAVALAGCGSTSSSPTSAASSPSATQVSATGSASGSGGASASTSSCGPKPGVRATGSPINIGAIATKQPGTDFTDVPNMVSAYFTCVNANGGVNGHPLKLIAQFDQTQPSQIAAAANLLVHTDHVVGIVGAFDLLECTIDQRLWKQLGVYEIDAGTAPECWSTANSAPINLGARFSIDGAVQYALAQHVAKVVFDTANTPGNGYFSGGAVDLAHAAHVPITTEVDNVPITDANSVALRLVDQAGPNGAVVLGFTPPEALSILQAAQKLGLEDRVKEWGCSSPCATDFLAKALGPKWDHKLFVNTELTPPDGAHTPEFQLYRAVLGKYGQSVSGGIGSFSQMGFVMAEFTVKALEATKPPYTLKSVNAALKGITDYHSDMLCRPWTYGDFPLHVPNSVDYTTTPESGQMRTIQGCTAISSADPALAEYLKVGGGR
jgi:branched-chain amino acid transport system substrate-binding protein